MENNVNTISNFFMQVLQNFMQSFAQIFTVSNVFIGTVAIILLLWLWFRIRAVQNPPTILSFRTQNGEVRITYHALSDFVSKVAAGVEGIDRCHCRIFWQRNLYNLELRVHLSDNYQLTEVVQQVELKVSQAIRNTLGLEELGKINTVVVSLSKKKFCNKMSGSETPGNRHDILEEETTY